MSIAQIGIMVFGCSSIWLIGRKEEWRKWGYALGLCSQPFWFYTTYVNEQWGIFILSFWYLYAWLQGTYNFILVPLKESPHKSCEYSGEPCEYAAYDEADMFECSAMHIEQCQEQQGG